MKYTHDMIETCIQGDLYIAIVKLTNIANKEYTVENLQTDVEEACITQEELDDIRNYERFHRG